MDECPEDVSLTVDLRNCRRLCVCGLTHEGVDMAVFKTMPMIMLCVVHSAVKYGTGD